MFQGLENMIIFTIQSKIELRDLRKYFLPNPERNVQSLDNHNKMMPINCLAQVNMHSPHNLKTNNRFKKAKKKYFRFPERQFLIRKIKSAQETMKLDLDLENNFRVIISQEDYIKLIPYICLKKLFLENNQNINTTIPSIKLIVWEFIVIQNLQVQNAGNSTSN